MRRLLIVASIAALASCSSQTRSLDDALENPLMAAEYGDQLAITLANLIISKDPIVQQDGMEAIIQREIASAKSIAKIGKEIANQGMRGTLVAQHESEQSDGEATYVNDTLYFSPSFYVSPGPALHVYLTQEVIPEEGKFPNDTSINLGKIQSPYGVQQYGVPRQDKPELYRTLVIYDTTLKRIFAFAQLSKRSS
jgi:hypothetical protein